MYRHSKLALLSLSLTAIATAQDGNADYRQDANDADAQSIEKSSGPDTSASQPADDRTAALRLEFDADAQTLRVEGGRAQTRPLLLIELADANTQPLDDDPIVIIDPSLSFHADAFDDSGVARLWIGAAAAAALEGKQMRVQAVALIEDSKQQLQDWAVSDILTLGDAASVPVARRQQPMGTWMEMRPKAKRDDGDEGTAGVRIYMADAGHRQRVSFDAIAQDDFRGDWTVHLTIFEDADDADSDASTSHGQETFQELPGAKTGQRVQVWVRHKSANSDMVTPYSLLEEMEVTYGLR